jgi:methionyl-tRNA formyltransferase
MGTPQIAAATLEHLVAGPDTVVGVVTQPDSSAGRGQKTSPSPVRKLAESRDIAVLAAEKIRTPDFLESLRNWQPDIIVVVAYGRILPKPVLELAPHGCVNVHYSLLPKYRGAAPVAWTIINGEAEAGVSTMKLVEKMDAGDIYCKSYQAHRSRDHWSLQTRQLLAAVAGNVALTKEGTLAQLNKMKPDPGANLEKEDGLIDWQRSALEIEPHSRLRSLAWKFHALLWQNAQDSSSHYHRHRAARRPRRNHPRRCRGILAGHIVGRLESRRSAAGKQETSTRRRIHQGREDQTR